MLSSEQRAIILKICDTQEGSFIEVAEKHIERIYLELRDEGYEISISDVAEEVTRKIQQWDEVRKDPEKFLHLLDEQEIGMVKHHLINDFMGLSRPIWKRLNLFDKANEYRN